MKYLIAIFMALAFMAGFSQPASADPVFTVSTVVKCRDNGKTVVRLKVRNNTGITRTAEAYYAFEVTGGGYIAFELPPFTQNSANIVLPNRALDTLNVFNNRNLVYTASNIKPLEC